MPGRSITCPRCHREGVEHGGHGLCRKCASADRDALRGSRPRKTFRVIRCHGCKRRRVVCAHGLCYTCYEKEYRKTYERPVHLGNCRDCHEYRQLFNLGLCTKCYERRRRADPEKNARKNLHKREARARQRKRVAT